MTQVDGHCDARFSKVRDVMRDFISSGQDVGASICLNINGEDMVDLWGGYADASSQKPWQRDTIVNVFSSTKLVTNLAALVLISRGLLKADSKVANYWPEFAQNGKEDVTVAHVLSHSAGVAGWDAEMTLERMADIRASAELLASQAPWWTPGNAVGYHAITQGVILAELVRRVTGLGLDEFVAREMAGPLGADFRYGCRDGDDVAPVIPPEGPPIQEILSQLASDSISARTLLNPVFSADAANTALWRSSVLPSLNGHTNARALVKILSCLSLGGKSASGYSLLSGETVENALAEHSSGIDMVVGGSTRRGLGVYLTGKETSFGNKLPQGRLCVGGGWGGSVVIMDAERKLTFAYTMNKMRDEMPSRTAQAYINAIYGELGVVLG